MIAIESSGPHRMTVGMATTSPNLNVQPVVTPEQIMRSREVVNTVYVDEKVRDYIVDIVIATRDPKAYRLDFPGWIQYGASPRAGGV